MNNKIVRSILDIALYLVAFLLIQVFMSWLVAGISLSLHGTNISDIFRAVMTGHYTINGQLVGIVSAMSSVLTIGLFLWRKWAVVSRTYIATRPWVAISWVVLLTLGTILPSEWIVERINITMPDHMVQLFEQIMGSSAGYIAIGILAPLAEELVFRGAILRTLLHLFSDKQHWIAIAISALIFGAMHMNLAQFAHAFVIGLLIGWMYYRTNSIIPGVVLHWVNNTVAYLMFNLFPQAGDGKLIDIFHGNTHMMTGGLIFSLCILIPSLFQLAIRLRK